MHHDSANPLGTIRNGDAIFVKYFTAQRSPWIPGEIVEVSGPLSYHVQLESEKIVCRHVDAFQRWGIRVFPTSALSQPANDNFYTAEDDLYLPSVLPIHPGINSFIPSAPASLSSHPLHGLTRHIRPLNQYSSSI